MLASSYPVFEDMDNVHKRQSHPIRVAFLLFIWTRKAAVNRRGFRRNASPTGGASIKKSTFSTNQRFRFSLTQIYVIIMSEIVNFLNYGG